MARPDPSLAVAALLVMTLATGCSRTQPGASVVFEFASTQPVSDESLSALLPADDPSIRIHRVEGTNLFEVTVPDPDPSSAVRRANGAVDALRSRLHNEATGTQFRIWQRARPAEVPRT